MSNPTGLIVALMFATIVTMAVVNLLSLFAERLKATGGVLADVGETLWLILVMLISLSMFWQCIDILNIEDWSFTEFLFIVLGASILFFSTTSIPKFKISDGEIQRLKENRVFFYLMASFQAWLLLLDATLGAAPVFFIFFRLICFGSMIAAAVSSSAKALWLSSAAFVASLVILIVLQSLASRI